MLFNNWYVHLCRGAENYEWACTGLRPSAKYYEGICTKAQDMYNNCYVWWVVGNLVSWMINLFVININMRVPRLWVNMKVRVITDNAMLTNNANTFTSSHSVVDEWVMQASVPTKAQMIFRRIWHIVIASYDGHYDWYGHVCALAHSRCVCNAVWLLITKHNVVITDLNMSVPRHSVCIIGVCPSANYYERIYLRQGAEYV